MVNVYAIVNDAGKCTGVMETLCIINKRTYVPITALSLSYISCYYSPLPEFVDSSDDFNGTWYSDMSHTVIKEAI